MNDQRLRGCCAAVVTGLLLTVLAVAAGPLEDAMKSGRDFFDKGDYRNATEQFKKAFALSPQDPGINFYLGRAAFELKDYETAFMAFDRVESQNPNYPRVKLELARTYLELGLHDMAKELFTDILATNPPPAVCQNINQFMARINQAKRCSFFSGELTLGVQYDSNARVSPASDQVDTVYGPITLDPNSAEKADTINTATLTLNHLYRWPDSPWSWKSSLIDYSAFYVQENDLDLNYLGVMTGPALQKDTWGADLLATGNYILKDYDDYLVSGGIMADYSLNLNARTVFVVGGKLEAKRYLTDPQREAGNATVSLGPNFSFGLNKILLRIGLERENATDGIFSYTKPFSSIRYERQLPWGLTPYASWRYQRVTYDKRDPTFPQDREDQVHEVTVGICKQLTERFTLDFNHTYTNSLSTLGLYEYDRQLTSLSLSIGF